MATCFLRPVYHLNIGGKAGGGKGVGLFVFKYSYLRSLGLNPSDLLLAFTQGLRGKENWVWNIVRDKNHYQAQSDSCYATKYSVKPCLRDTNEHHSKFRLFKLV